jgi:hypothetical protein
MFSVPVPRHPCRAPLVLLASLALILTSIPLTSRARAADNSAVPVLLRKTADGSGWQLTRDGKPFFIRGVGGSRSLQLLADCGGNAFRTWGADEGLQRQLDEAHKLGLAVTVGLWLGHERHGFNYADAKQVADQLERCRTAIARYKDHPAVLMWGIGTEMEGYKEGDNPAIWKAVDDVAALAKKLDPNHPTMTVVAEVGGRRVPSIHELCPAIDIVGVNSYGGGPTLARRYREAGGSKPFVITEFGPPGMWESPKTPWDAPIEPTSTAKADFYRKTYQSSVLAETDKLCVGSFAFLWGWKQEATSTWFGMLLPDGSRTAAVDAMSELWTGGHAPANRCPRIESIELADGADAGAIAPDSLVRATLRANDPENEELRVEWQLHREVEQHLTGGDRQAPPPTYPKAIVRGDARGAEVKLPTEPGGYRLFAIVRDGHGGAAVANVPLRVR